MVKWLIEKGADPTIENDDGRSALIGTALEGKKWKRSIQKTLGWPPHEVVEVESQKKAKDMQELYLWIINKVDLHPLQPSSPTSKNCFLVKLAEMCPDALDATMSILIKKKGYWNGVNWVKYNFAKSSEKHYKMIQSPLV